MNFNAENQAAIDETSRVSALDLYEDLLVTDGNEGDVLSIHEVNYEKQQLEEQNRLLRLQLAEATTSLKTVTEQNQSLKVNFTSLLETAKVELERKNKVINRLSGKHTQPSAHTKQPPIRPVKKSQGYSSVSLKGRRINEQEILALSGSNSNRNKTKEKKVDPTTSNSSNSSNDLRQKLQKTNDINTTPSPSVGTNPNPRTVTPDVSKEKGHTVDNILNTKTSGKKDHKKNTVDQPKINQEKINENLHKVHRKDLQGNNVRMTNEITVQKNNESRMACEKLLTLTPTFTPTKNLVSRIENSNGIILNRTGITKSNESASNNKKLSSRLLENRIGDQYVGGEQIPKSKTQNTIEGLVGTVTTPIAPLTSGMKNKTTSIYEESTAKGINKHMSTKPCRQNSLEPSLNQITPSTIVRNPELETKNLFNKSTINKEKTTEKMNKTLPSDVATNNGLVQSFNNLPKKKNKSVNGINTEKVVGNVETSQPISLPNHDKRDPQGNEIKKLPVPEIKKLSVKLPVTHNTIDRYFQNQATLKCDTSKKNSDKNSQKLVPGRVVQPGDKHSKEQSQTNNDLRNHSYLNIHGNGHAIQHNSVDKNTKEGNYDQEYSPTCNDHSKADNEDKHLTHKSRTADKDSRKRLSSRERVSSRDGVSSREHRLSREHISSSRGHRPSRDHGSSRDNKSRSSKDKESRTPKDNNSRSSKDKESRTFKDNNSRSSKDNNSRTSKDNNSRTSKDNNSRTSKDKDLGSSRDNNSRSSKYNNSRTSKDQESRTSKDKDPGSSRDNNPRSSKDNNSRTSKDKDSRLSKDKYSNSSKEVLKSSWDRKYSDEYKSSRISKDDKYSRDRLYSKDKPPSSLDRCKQRSPILSIKRRSSNDGRRDKISEKQNNVYDKNKQEQHGIVDRLQTLHSNAGNNKNKLLSVVPGLHGYDKTDPLNLRGVALNNERSNSPIPQERIDPRTQRNPRLQEQNSKSRQSPVRTPLFKPDENQKKLQLPTVVNKMVDRSDGNRLISNTITKPVLNSNSMNIGNKKMSNFLQAYHKKKNSSKSIVSNKSTPPKTNMEKKKSKKYPLPQPVFEDLPGFGILDELDFDEDTQSKIYFHSQPNDHKSVPQLDPTINDKNKAQKDRNETVKAIVPINNNLHCKSNAKGMSDPPNVERTITEAGICIEPVLKMRKESLKTLDKERKRSIKRNRDFLSTPEKRKLEPILRRSPRVKKQGIMPSLCNTGYKQNRNVDKKRKLSFETSTPVSAAKTMKMTNATAVKIDPIAECLIRNVTVNLGKKVCMPFKNTSTSKPTLPVSTGTPITPILNKNKPSGNTKPDRTKHKLSLKISRGKLVTNSKNKVNLNTSVAPSKDIVKDVDFIEEASRVEEVTPEKSANASGSFMEFYRNASLQYLLHLSKTTLCILKSKLRLNNPVQPSSPQLVETVATSPNSNIQPNPTSATSSSEKENSRNHEPTKRRNSRSMWLTSLDECQHRRKRNSQWMEQREEENKLPLPTEIIRSEKRKCDFSPLKADETCTNSSINSWTLNEESMNQFFNLANIVNIVTPIKNTPVRPQNNSSSSQGCNATELVQLQKVCRKVLQSPSKSKTCF